MGPSYYMKVYSYIRKGGMWLSSSREWMKSNVPRGDTLTWGSSEPVSIPFRKLEDLALRSANAAVNEFIDHKLTIAAAQYRYICPEEGPSIWCDCSLSDAAIYKSKPSSYEVRYLYVINL